MTCRDYAVETGGIVDTDEHIVSLLWDNPSSMHIGSWPCDFTEYDGSYFIFNGVDDGFLEIIKI